MAHAEACAPAGGPGALIIRIEVAAGVAPRQVWRVSLDMPARSTVEQALAASGAFEQVAGLDRGAIASGLWTVGVWGRRESLTHVLRDQDRIELYRGLQVDPKEARRVRYRAHGEKLPKGIHRPKPKPPISGD